MKRAYALGCVLAVVQYACAQCNFTPDYSTTFVPACDIDDIYIKWPNYWNASSYYTCVAVHEPVLMSCPTGLYFTYVLQMCTSCQSYIPPMPCENLKTQNPPICTSGPTTVLPTTSSPPITPPVGPPVSSTDVPSPPTPQPTPPLITRS